MLNTKDIVDRLSVDGIEEIQSKIDEIEKEPFEILYDHDKNRMSQKLVDIKSYEIYRKDCSKSPNNVNDENFWREKYKNYCGKKNEYNKNMIDGKNRSRRHAKWFNHSAQDSVFFDLLREFLNTILIAKGGQAHQHQLLENPFKDLAPFTMENNTLYEDVG